METFFIGEAGSIKKPHMNNQEDPSQLLLEAYNSFAMSKSF
jgi:hypothetical protein